MVLALAGFLRCDAVALEWNEERAVAARAKPGVREVRIRYGNGSSCNRGSEATVAHLPFELPREAL